MNESLEGRANRFSRIYQQFRRDPGNKPYLKDYLVNALKTIAGKKPTDYNVISHENIVVGSYIPGCNDNSYNRVSGAFLFDDYQPPGNDPGKY